MLKKPINVLAIRLLAVILILMGLAMESFSLHGLEPASVVIAGSVHQSDHLAFDWAVYDNPERPEFWDDGEGMPPRPFRYVAAHPTEENKTKLLAWIKKQHEAIDTVSKLLAKGLAPEVAAGDPSWKQGLGKIQFASLAGDDELASPKISWKDLSLVYIYRSGCEACLQHQSVMQKLEKLGASITYLQTDFGKEKALHPSSQDYTKELAALFPHEATPTIYLKAQGHETQRIEGAMPFEKIYSYVLQQFGGH